MKTKEELNALNNEVKALNKKLAELSDEELQQVAGGAHRSIYATDTTDCDVFPTHRLPQD